MPDFQMCTDEQCKYSTKCERHMHSGTKPQQFAQACGFFIKTGNDSKPENCTGWRPKQEIKE